MLTILAGTILRRDGARLLLLTDSGATWVEADSVRPHVADTVRVVGRVVAPGRREPMARAA